MILAGVKKNDVKRENRPVPDIRQDGRQNNNFFFKFGDCHTEWWNDHACVQFKYAKNKDTVGRYKQDICLRLQWKQKVIKRVES